MGGSDIITLTVIALDVLHWPSWPWMGGLGHQNTDHHSTGHHGIEQVALAFITLAIIALDMWPWPS